MTIPRISGVIRGIADYFEKREPVKNEAPNVMTGGFACGEEFIAVETEQDLGTAGYLAGDEYDLGDGYVKRTLTVSVEGLPEGTFIVTKPTGDGPVGIGMGSQIAYLEDDGEGNQIITTSIAELAEPDSLREIRFSNGPEGTNLDLNSEQMDDLYEAAGLSMENIELIHRVDNNEEGITDEDVALVDELLNEEVSGLDVLLVKANVLIENLFIDYYYEYVAAVREGLDPAKLGTELEGLLSLAGVGGTEDDYMEKLGLDVDPDQEVEVSDLAKGFVEFLREKNKLNAIKVVAVNKNLHGLLGFSRKRSLSREELQLSGDDDLDVEAHSSYVYRELDNNNAYTENYVARRQVTVSYGGYDAWDVERIRLDALAGDASYADVYEYKITEDGVDYVYFIQYQNGPDPQFLVIQESGSSAGNDVVYAVVDDDPVPEIPGQVIMENETAFVERFVRLDYKEVDVVEDGQIIATWGQYTYAYEANDILYSPNITMSNAPDKLRHMYDEKVMAPMILAMQDDVLSANPPIILAVVNGEVTTGALGGTQSFAALGMLDAIAGGVVIGDYDVVSADVATMSSLMPRVILLIPEEAYTLVEGDNDSTVLLKCEGVEFVLTMTVDANNDWLYLGYLKTVLFDPLTEDEQ